jgi:diguanylate cyclase (GGDEF)-like protein
VLKRGSDASRAQRLVTLLGVLGWVVAVASVSCYLLLPSSPGTTQQILLVTIAVFFVIVLARLIAALVARQTRRRPLIVLIISVVLWAAGSAELNASVQPLLTKFPSPGEWFFLAAYVGFAGYLSLDARTRYSDIRGSWLEAIVLCGGTASLIGAVLLQPVSHAAGHQGLALLTALLYPSLDLVLLLVVVAQHAVHTRTRRWSSAQLVLGFSLFVIADSGFMLNVSGQGVYDISVAGDSLWGIGFLLITGSACRRPNADGKAVVSRTSPVPMLLASAAAVLVLVIRPIDWTSTYLVSVAVLTLAAAAGRLVLALREANGAAEAFALSRTDDLTLLPNRRAVLSRVDTGLGSKEPLSLMLLDLDGFKEINDTLGHGAGDTVLQIAAQRMREALPQSALVARLGGDEFAVVVPVADEITLMEMGQHVIEVVSQPLTVDGIALSTGASIGITIRDARDQSSTDLLRRADVAMYQAKQSRAGALLYNADRDDFSRRKLQLAEDLRRGIRQGQLVLWYQPQIDAATQQLCGVEALVRWQHPKHGLLSPVEFLPAARRAGLMLQISEAVLSLAIADLRTWLAHGMDLRVAVNCAPPELLNGLFLPRLFAACEQAQIPPDRLVIEVTEDSFLSEPERARTILGQIRDHSVQIAIDDYGTGFSSLSYLRDLPVNELKMDRSFISALRTDPRSRMIVASTLQMAHALGLRTVAEGVEDAATMADLVAMGVDLLQGYHLARPMPAAELEPWFARWRSMVA